MSKIQIALGVDSHTHARDLEQENVMTIMQTFKEANLSGVGAMCLMPNTKPSIDNELTLNDYLELIDLAERETQVKGYVWVGLTDSNHDEVMKMLTYKKVVGVKIYPLKNNGQSVTTGTVGIKDWSSINKLLQMMQEANIDKPIAGHWEDPEIVAVEGNTVNAEISALKKLVEIAEEFPQFRYVACHITSYKGASIIEDAQEDGKLKIAMEITPHHLWFSNEIVDTSLGIHYCLPPIKTTEDRNWLRRFLADNGNNPLVFIGSDTAPHPVKNKMSDNPPGGLATHQHIIPVMLSLMEKLELDISCITNLTSANAARFLDIPLPTGEAKWSLESHIDERVYNNGKVLNPFEGEKLVGKMIEEAA